MILPLCPAIFGCGAFWVSPIITSTKSNNMQLLPLHILLGFSIGLWGGLNEKPLWLVMAIYLPISISLAVLEHMAF